MMLGDGGGQVHMADIEFSDFGRDFPSAFPLPAASFIWPAPTL